jgi:signal peptidase complex subunit 1
MIAVVAGFVNQDIFIALWTGLGLTLMVMLLVVPAWPIFRRHPVRYLGSTTIIPAGGIVVGGKKVQ